MIHSACKMVALCAVLTLAQTPWLDPASFPRALACDSTGLVQPYSDYYHGVNQYKIRTTLRGRSPVIDGVLDGDGDSSIWYYAETLLVNSWEDAGRAEACSDNPVFYGPLDLHAIWRFCYNKEGLYVGAEVHDDVWDVDSLKGWDRQDGVEIAVDPWEWGDYTSGKWAQNQFRRYWTAGNAIQPFSDGSHMCFFQILKRANDEPYISGLIYGTHLANYSRGDEATNFTRGNSNLYGIDFAVARIGVDAWGRTVHHYEFKVPYHTTLWNALEGTGYFDSTGLPQAGNVFKLNVVNNDDDMPGPDGSNPSIGRMDRTRNGGVQDGFVAYDSHWSDNHYFMVMKYAGNAVTPVAHPLPFLACCTHGHNGIIDNWVDAATESYRYDFTAAGTCIIDSIFYFYDSVAGNGNMGKISTIQNGTQMATYTVSRPDANNYLKDTLKITMGATNLVLVRMLKGWTEMEGRWVQASMKERTYPCNRYFFMWDTVWEIPANAQEFRFCPLSRMDKVKITLPQYQACADSLRIYKYANDSLVARYAFTYRSAIVGRDSTKFDYEIRKIVNASDVNAPRNLIVRWRPPVSRTDTLVEIKPYPLSRFGETGNNVNQRLTLNVKSGPDSINQLLIIDKYATYPKVMIYPDTGTTAVKNATRLYGTFYDDMVLVTDSSKASYWSALGRCGITLDTNYLLGYDSLTRTAQSIMHKDPSQYVFPDHSWLQQVCRLVIQAKPGVSDTFIFRDTTHIQYWNYFMPIPTGIFNTIDTVACPGAVEGGDSDSIQTITLDNYPNPFNPTTTLRIAIPAQYPASLYALNIYDVRGRLVRMLEKGIAGRHSLVKKVIWDGTDNLGKAVSAGIYYYRLNVGPKIKKGALVMVK